MTVINILKDGTIVDDMSKVTVPKEIVENMIRIMMNNKKERTEKINEKRIIGNY